MALNLHKVLGCGVYIYRERDIYIFTLDKREMNLQNS